MRQIAAIVTSASVLFGCFAAAAETRGVSGDSIKIGSVTDLSGPLASWGIAATNGQRMRYEEANSAGGVNGRKIEFIAVDMQYQIPLAVQAANRLMTNDQVFAFVANLGTPPNNAIMQRTIDAGFPYIFPLSAGLSMSEPPNPLKIAYLLDDRDTMRGAVKHILEKTGAKKICYQVMANDYGDEVETGIKSEAQALGLQITASGKHKATETDFTAAILQLKTSGCEALFIGSVGRDATQIYTAARGAGWNVPIVSSLGALVPQVAQNPAMEGFYSAAPFSLIDFEGAKDSQPKVYDWYQRYKARFGMDPSAQSVIGYNMADITVKALELAGRDLTVEGFMQAFRKIKNYKDAFGGPEVSFEKATHYGAPYSVLSQVRSGKWVVAAPSLPF